MSNEVTLTDDTFKEEVLEETDQPVMVDFWASWCGPCKTMSPIIEELADEYSDSAKICKLSVEDNKRTASQYGVRSIPTILFFQDGEVVEQMVGAVPKPELKEKIEELL